MYMPRIYLKKQDESLVRHLNRKIGRNLTVQVKFVIY